MNDYQTHIYLKQLSLKILPNKRQKKEMKDGRGDSWETKEAKKRHASKVKEKLISAPMLGMQVKPYHRELLHKRWNTKVGE